MNRHLLVVVALLVVACSTAEVIAETVAPLAPRAAAPQSAGGQQPARTPALAYHVQILEWLRSSDAVIPPAPKAHPLTAVYNREAIVPAMCYTRTEGRYNPCYVCHQDSLPGRENTMNDGDLQEAYSFSDVGMTNHWQNLFEDRSERVKRISDEEILAWVSQDNYSVLADRLSAAGFKGWIPDLKGLADGAAAFDAEGIARDGSHWVAFNYKPFPSTFWPTNGSTDDIMIRLPEPYRTDRAGRYSRDVYLANLSIVELNIKNLSSVSLPNIDEARVGDDLDGDGRTGVATRLARRSSYVGSAHQHVFFPGQYPMATDFMHTVRYLSFDAHGNVVNSRRMKEVRYLKKWQAVNKQTLEEYYREEGYAKDSGRLPAYTNLHHYGLDNGMGWSVQGFIEDRNGRLRANTYEENLFCMGCHTSIGSTIDKTFGFPRKVEGADGWGYINLKGMPDVPNVGEGRGEILTYFERAGSGDEFRSNLEMQARWFDAKGAVDLRKVAAARDVHDLITPSRDRALLLNKAYRVLVEDQDFIFGRDATVRPPKNVHDNVENESTVTLPPHATHRWDIRLDWSGGTPERRTAASAQRIETEGPRSCNGRGSE
jgi:hypothetical protein